MATDTTAGTLSFLFYQLSAQPEITAKLRREILENVGSHKAPSFEDIRNCSYLQKTISETLRLYPAVPYNVRLALKDTTLPHGAGPDGRQPVGIKKDTPIGEFNFRAGDRMSQSVLKDRMLAPTPDGTLIMLALPASLLASSTESPKKAHAEKVREADAQRRLLADDSPTRSQKLSTNFSGIPRHLRVLP